MSLRFLTHGCGWCRSVTWLPHRQAVLGCDATVVQCLRCTRYWHSGNCSWTSIRTCVFTSQGRHLWFNMCHCIHTSMSNAMQTSRVSQGFGNLTPPPVAKHAYDKPRLLGACLHSHGVAQRTVCLQPPSTQIVKVPSGLKFIRYSLQTMGLYNLHKLYLCDEKASWCMQLQ